MVTITKYKYKFYYCKKDILGDERNEFNMGRGPMPWSMTRRCNRLHEHDGYFLLISEFIDHLNEKLVELLNGYYGREVYFNSHFHIDRYYHYSFRLSFMLSFPQTKELSDDLFEHISELSVDGTTFRLSDKVLRGHTRNTVGRLTLLYYEV